MSEAFKINGNFTNSALNTRLLVTEEQEQSTINKTITSYQVSGYKAPQNISRNQTDKLQNLEEVVEENDPSINIIKIHDEEVHLVEVTIQEALQNINTQITDISREILWLKTKSKIFTGMQYVVPLFSTVSLGFQTAIAIAEEGFSSVWGSISLNGILLSVTTYSTVKYAGMKIEQIKLALEQKEAQKLLLTSEYERIFEKVQLKE